MRKLCFLIFLLTPMWAYCESGASLSVTDAQRIVGSHFVSGEIECPPKKPKCKEQLKLMNASLFGNLNNHNPTFFLIQNDKVIGSLPQCTSWDVLDLEGDGEYELVYVHDSCSGIPCPGVYEIPMKCVDYSSRFPPRTMKLFGFYPRKSKDGTIELYNGSEVVGRYVRSNKSKKGSSRQCFEIKWGKQE